MLIKLNYTSGKTVGQALRVVNEIINTPAVTSISSLRSTATTGTWAADLLQYLDDATSYIYRTTDTTGVVSHMARPAAASASFAFDWMVEFPTYDSPTAKQYMRLTCSSTTANSATEAFGSAISGSISSAQWAPSSPSSGSTSSGTTLTITGNITSGRGVAGTSSLLTTLWVYITPSSLVWCAVCSNGTFQPSGWYGTNSNYASTTTFSGPNIYSQYRRYDYWNTASNNILPFVYINPSNTNPGFLSVATELGINNPSSSTSAECSFNAFNYINATPGTGTSFPVTYGIRVATGVGTRFSDTFNLASSSGSSTNPTDPCYGAVVNTSTTQTRIPSSNLLTKGFSILPLTIRNMNVSMLGGNISDIGDFYLFNGDYFPGDEFSYNNRTFVIFPVGLGYTTRLGLAIPKE